MLSDLGQTRFIGQRRETAAHWMIRLF